MLESRRERVSGAKRSRKVTGVAPTERRHGRKEFGRDVIAASMSLCFVGMKLHAWRVATLRLHACNVP